MIGSSSQHEDEDYSFIAQSCSSDGANTIIHRERQRQKAGISTESTTTTPIATSRCFLCGNDPSLILEPHFPGTMDNVVIIGAGAIGGFVGCCLYDHGGRSYAQVTFLVRNPQYINRYGVLGFTAHSTVDHDFRASIPPKDVRRVFTTDPTCLREASCILVATKRSANADVHRLLCQHKITCPVVFLQNGMKIRDDLVKTTCTKTGRRLEVNYEVIESVIMMNISLNKETGVLTLGQPLKDVLLVLDGHQQSADEVCDLFDGSAIAVYAEKSHDFIGLQAAKIQATMTNAINALSGVTMEAMMREPGYRLVLAHCIDECRAVFAAHKIPIQAVGNEMSNLRLMLMSTFLRTWNVIFLPFMGSKLELLKCTCSMAQDLDNCVRPTEIDHLNGVVVRLGQLSGVPTPINEKIVELMKRAEALQLGSPKLGPHTLLTEVGLVRASNPMNGREDARNMIMSFDSLRETSINESLTPLSMASDRSPFSIGERVRSTLAIAMFSSEELSYVGSPPVSPVKKAAGIGPSTLAATLSTPPQPADRGTAETMMGFDRSVRLWN